MNQTTACTCLPTTPPLPRIGKTPPDTSPHLSLSSLSPLTKRKNSKHLRALAPTKKAAISVLRISLETPPPPLLFITLHSTTSLPPPITFQKTPQHPTPVLPKPPLLNPPPNPSYKKKTPETALFVPRAPPKNSLPSSVPEMGFSLLGRLVS